MPLAPLAVAIRHADRYVCAPDWIIDPMIPGSNAFFFIRAGAGHVTYEDNRFDARPGDLFISRPWRRMAAGHDPHDPITVLSIGFNLTDPAGQDVLAPTRLPERMRLTPREQQAVEPIFENVIRPYKQPGFSASVTARSVMLELIAHVIDLADRLPPKRREGSVARVTVRDPRIEKICAAIEAHPERDVSLDDLARRAHLSRSHLVTRFRQSTGRTPMDYLRHCRIESAKRHLAEGRLTVAEVAHRVGYDDPFHFSRLFRRIVGVAPTAYAASVRSPFNP